MDADAMVLGAPPTTTVSFAGTGSNPEPTIVRTVPALPIVGEKLEITTGDETTKSVVLTAVFAPTVTDTRPVAAPVGTVKVSRVAVELLTTAATPPSRTTLLEGRSSKPDP